MWLLHTTMSIKLQDTPTLIHHQVLEFIKVNIFLRPEEAVFKNWRKLLSNKSIVLDVFAITG